MLCHGKQVLPTPPNRLIMPAFGINMQKEDWWLEEEGEGGGTLGNEWIHHPWTKTLQICDNTLFKCVIRAVMYSTVCLIPVVIIFLSFYLSYKEKKTWIDLRLRRLFDLHVCKFDLGRVDCRVNRASWLLDANMMLNDALWQACSLAPVRLNLAACGRFGIVGKHQGSRKIGCKVR